MSAAAASAGTQPDASVQFVLAKGDETKLKDEFAWYLRHVICRQMKRESAETIKRAAIDQKAAEALSPYAKQMLDGVLSFSKHTQRFMAWIDSSELMNKSKSGFEIARRRQFMNAIESSTRIALESVPESAGEPLCFTTQQTLKSELKYVALTNRNGHRAGRWMDKSLVNVARLLLFLITIDYQVEIAVDSEITVRSTTFEQLLKDTRSSTSRFGLMFQEWIKCRRHLIRIFELENVPQPPEPLSTEYQPAAINRVPWTLPASVTPAQMIGAVELGILPDVIGAEVKTFPFVTHGDVKEMRIRREAEIKTVLVMMKRPDEKEADSKSSRAPVLLREMENWFKANRPLAMRLFQMYLQLENGAPRNAAEDAKNLAFAQKHFTGNIQVFADILKKLTITPVSA